MKDIIATSLEQSIDAKKRFAEQYSDSILAVVDQLVAVFNNDGKVLICGNGGSAADAQHMAAEFVNRFIIDRPPLAAVALISNFLTTESLYIKGFSLL